MIYSIYGSYSPSKSSGYSLIYEGGWGNLDFWLIEDGWLVSCCLFSLARFMSAFIRDFSNTQKKWGFS